MIDLSWGGFTNGSVPDSATTVIDSAGHRLEHVAAKQFLAMQAACLKETGKTFYVAPGADSANRTVAQQQADWAIYQNGGNTAAYPGTSNHGWARAVDITGYETALGGWVFGRYVNTGVVWRWLMANMARFGYSWDTGRASRESWHFESYNTPSATAIASVSSTPITEPKASIDMPQLRHRQDKNPQGVVVTTYALYDGTHWDETTDRPTANGWATFYGSSVEIPVSTPDGKPTDAKAYWDIRSNDPNRLSFFGPHTR